MRWIYFALLICSNVVSAADYRHDTTLITSGNHSHYQFYLPEAFYLSGGEAWGGDIRIVNANGETVAFSVLSPFDGVQQQAQWQSVNWFPLPHASAATQHTKITIASDGQLHWTNASQPALNQIDQIVIDRLQVTNYASQVLINAAGNIPFVSQVTIEGSDDLSQWHNIAPTQTLAFLQHQQHTIARHIVDVNANTFRYWKLRRLSGDPLPALQSILVQHQQSITEPWPQRTRQVCGERVRLKNGQLAIEFDLGARFTARQFFVQLPEENLVLPTQLWVNERDRQHFHWQRDVLLYRFGGNTPYDSGYVHHAAASSQYWRLVLQQPQLSWPTGHLRMRFSYEPELIVFAARGPGPYHLRWGFEQKVPGDITIDDLVPGFVANRIPQFALADVTPITVHVDPPTTENVVESRDHSRLILWAVLVLGVIALFVMVWRLRREFNYDSSAN
jgi:hypothetical protein